MSNKNNNNCDNENLVNIDSEYGEGLTVEQYLIKENEELIDDNEKLIIENERLTQDNDECIEALKKAQAEFENFRKRTLKEKEDIAKLANGRLLMKMLPAMDHYAMALKLLIDQKDGKDEAIIDGLTMVEKQLVTILTEEGLNPIEAVGKEFDPNIHEAFMQEDHPTIDSGMIISELQKGYMLNGKVLRPSLVNVAK